MCLVSAGSAIRNHELQLLNSSDPEITSAPYSNAKDQRRAKHPKVPCEFWFWRLCCTCFGQFWFMITLTCGFNSDSIDRTSKRWCQVVPRPARGRLELPHHVEQRPSQGMDLGRETTSGNPATKTAEKSWFKQDLSSKQLGFHMGTSWEVSKHGNFPAMLDD